VRLEADVWCEIYREGVLIKRTGMAKGFIDEMPRVGFNIG
jgi:hypothetical protein